MASSGGPVTLCCVPIGSGIVTSFSKTGISLPGFKLWLLACKVSALPLSQLRNILLFHLNKLRVLGYGSRATAPLVKYMYIHCIKWSILSFSHTINCLHLFMHVNRKNIFAKIFKYKYAILIYLNDTIYDLLFISCQLHVLYISVVMTDSYIVAVIKCLNTK